MDLAFAGCAAVVQTGNDRICELGDARTLRLVVPGPAEEVSASAGEKLTLKREGERVVVDVPANATELVVTNETGRFVLPIAPAKKHAWLEAARAKRQSGDFAGAAEIAKERVANAQDPAERGLANGTLARIALARGRADEAFPLFRAAIDAHRSAGRVSDAIDDSFALAFAFHQRSHRYGDARTTLEAMSGLLPLYPEGRARDPYYRGILASETGDRRGAIAMLRDAESRAHTLGMTRLERNAKAAIALEMQAVGRARASLAILRALEKDPEASPCERVEVANDLGWGALLANEAAGSRVEEARAPLERAIAVEGCKDAYVRSFALGNLARLALDEGDIATAKKRLDEAKAAVSEPRGTERLFWLDVEARIVLAGGKAREALDLFDAERKNAQVALLADAEWAALVGRAAALEALGKKDDAIASLASAEELTDRAMLLVPLGEGRGSFVADRSASARAAIDLLVSVSRYEDAAHVARRSRARVLASVQRGLAIERLAPAERARWEEAVRAYRAAREAIDAEAAKDWTLPADRFARVAEERKTRERDLRAALESALAGAARGGDTADVPPPDGEIAIVIHPGRKGWLAFAVGSGATSAYAIPNPDAPDLARALFDPVATRIGHARAVHVQAYGAWRGVDVHALPFEGVPLVARVMVDYPLGLRAPGGDVPDRAVVVGDPTGDLPRARSEAKAVARTLSMQTKVDSLIGTAATRRAVGEALPGAGVLHYAGHGLFGGEDGFESSLPLAEGGRLTIGDVLALSPAPRKIVLSGCEAAKSEGESEGLGLAQAFLAAGAYEVVAPVRPVSDTLAERVSIALYEDTNGKDSLARALRAAQLAVCAADPSADWKAFRVLAP
jgi:tetratricopeptide (TPR) repeat protein